MSAERRTLLEIREEIDGLKRPEDREEVRVYAKQFRTIMARGGPLSEMALVLCAAELAAQDADLLLGEME